MIFVLLALIAGATAQVSNTIASADESVTEVVPVYDNRAERAWLGPNGNEELFQQANAARAALAVYMAPLVGGATAAVIAAALSTDACPVAADPTVYMVNATAYQAFLCCQLQPFLLPGLPAIVAAVYAHFLPGAPMLDWSTATGLSGVAQIRVIDTNSTNIVRCKDDVRIHVPESLELQALTVAGIMGEIMRSLEYAAEIAQDLAVCLAPSPPSACLSSAPAPLTAANAAAMLSFYQYTPPYIATCSQAALAAFEAFRTSTTWCPIPP
jgi:hypothetical protein